MFLEPLGHDVPSDVPAPARAGARALELADRHQAMFAHDAAAAQTTRELCNDVMSLSLIHI